MTDLFSTPENSRPTIPINGTTKHIGPHKPETTEERKEALNLLSYSIKYSLDQIHVVYSRKHNSVLHDPLTGKPVFNIRRELLHEVAKQFKGKIVTAKEAINLMLTNKAEI